MSSKNKKIKRKCFAFHIGLIGNEDVDLLAKEVCVDCIPFDGLPYFS